MQIKTVVGEYGHAKRKREKKDKEHKEHKHNGKKMQRERKSMQLKLFIEGIKRGRQNIKNSKENK